MITVRNVFQVKFGKGDEMVALAKERRQSLTPDLGMRILTDLSGPMFTVVLEFSAPSLAEWQKMQAEEFARPEFRAMFARMAPLIEMGRREYYTVEE